MCNLQGVVPRGGIQVKKIKFCFQVLGGSLAAPATNNNTNKIFLWIGSFPEKDLSALCRCIFDDA
jgi:hypothetical protein